MVCPSRPLASLRKSMVLMHTVRAFLTRFQARGGQWTAGAGNQSRRREWLGYLLPAPPPCWAVVCHLLPLVPLPVHGAPPGSRASPFSLPSRPTGDDGFSLLLVPRTPLSSVGSCWPKRYPYYPCNPLYPSSTFCTLQSFVLKMAIFSAGKRNIEVHCLMEVSTQ